MAFKIFNSFRNLAKEFYSGKTFVAFDTETTGLPKEYDAPYTDIDNWPRLVQLAWIVYDYRECFAI